MEYVVLCHPRSLGLELQYNRPAFCALPGLTEAWVTSQEQFRAASVLCRTAQPGSFYGQLSEFTESLIFRTSHLIYGLACPTCAFTRTYVTVASSTISPLEEYCPCTSASSKHCSKSAPVKRSLLSSSLWHLLFL